MKRAKPLRTLEELWDLEDQHPLVDASAGGLLRWMFATGMLAGSSPSERRVRSRRNGASSRRGKSGRH